MGSVVSDLRYAGRRLARTPAFTLAAVVTLALGVGATTAVFAAVNALVLRPVRAAQLDDVHHLGLASRAWFIHSGGLPIAHFRALQSDVPDVVEAVDAQVTLVDRGFIAQVPGRAERVEAIGITGGHAAVFRLRPQIGRFVTTEDERSNAPVAVISSRIWRDWFGGDKAILERGTIRLDDATFRIIGVAPPGYRGLFGFGLANVDVWVPFNLLPTATTSDPRRLTAVSIRLRVGVPSAQAAERIKPVVEHVALPRGLRNEPYRVVLSPATGQHPVITRVGSALLWLSALVLVAACANFTNLLYTRGSHRIGEIAVRRALGATSPEILRLALAEALVLACLASALGFIIALGATHLLNESFPSFQDRASRVAVDVTPDYRVLLYALTTGFASALLAGALTAWHAIQITPLRGLAVAGRTTTGGAHTRIRLVVVGLQVSAAVIAVMGASLYAQQTSGVFEERLTFDTRQVATARIDLSRHGYNDSRAQAFLARLLDDTRAIPSVQIAALSDGMPGSVTMGGEGVTVAAERQRPTAEATRYADGSHRRANGRLFSTSPGFVATVGLSLEEGRDFDERDRETAQLVAMVSQNVAAELWGAGSHLGKRLMLGNDGRWRTVVGVFADPATVKSFELGFRASNAVLVPLEQRHQPSLTHHDSGYGARFTREIVIAIRSTEQRGALDALRAAVAAIDENVAIFDAAPLDQSMLSSAAPVRAARLLLALLAFVTTAISLTGLYSVVAFMVARRTREFGIRIALGASPRQVARLVIADARPALLIGLLAGTLAVALGERLLDARYFRLLPNEVSTWATVLPLFLCVGLLAAYVPARRAARLEPTTALRHE